MLTVIEQLLPAPHLAQFREQLQHVDWQDGRQTAGTLARNVKHNQQLPVDSALARSLGAQLQQVLATHPLFIAAALPARLHPPRFNRHQGGGHYGVHVDNAILWPDAQTGALRADLSATLFLSDPDTYTGGELQIETRYGAQQVKLAAGDLLLYPADSLHQVLPVTAGERLAAFFWIQSLVRDDGERTLLFDLDRSIQALTAAAAPAAQVLALSGIYHNLLRRWATP